MVKSFFSSTSEFKDGSSQLNRGDLAIIAHEVTHHIAGHTSLGLLAKMKLHFGTGWKAAIFRPRYHPMHS